MKTFLTGGITAVPGILAAGMAAGIKKADVPDLALIVSEREATAAGGFTPNKGGAAPGLFGRPPLRRGKGLGLLPNNGKPNGCPGPPGYADARKNAAPPAQAPARCPRGGYV